MKGRKLLEISLVLVMIFSITLTENIQMADAVAASITSAEVISPTQVRITYDVAIDTVVGDYSDLNVAGEARTIDSIAEVGATTTATLTFSGGSAVGTDATGDIDIAAIADGGSGNTFAGATNQVLADAQPPTVLSAATTSSTTIALTMSETMVENANNPGDFVVSGVASTPTVGSFVTAGSTITLTLTGGSIVDTDVITVAYTGTAANDLEDAAGNDLEDFAGQAVTNNVAAPPTPKKGGGGCSGDCTNPTLGVNDQGRRLVDNGFSYNGNPVDVEHFFTPYPLITVDVGVPNLAEFKIYDNSGADKVWHFELAFGLGNGESIDKNQAMIIWDKTWDGIETTELDDPDNVLDKVRVTTSEVLCQEDSNQMCLLVEVYHIFRAPLEFNILGTNVWDAKRNAMQNYYNHGIEVEGKSMNPSLTKEIPGTYKNEGLVTIYQSELYSNLWAAEDGRVFELFGPNDSFKLTNPDVQRHEDTGVMKDRNHSSFNGWKEFQAELATSMFDSSYIQSIAPEPFSYDFPEVDSRTLFLIDNDMLELIR